MREGAQLGTEGQRRPKSLKKAKVKVITCKSLCLSHLEYASAARDVSTVRDIKNLEMVQNQATRFIANIKGREGVSDAKQRLGLTTQT